MSQYPPPEPVNPNFDSSLPPTGQPRSNALALTAMILGIVGVPCFPSGIVAIILGILALSKINKDPTAAGGKGMAVTGIVLGACGLVCLVPALLFASAFAPSLGKARELSNRSVCAANLRGIMQSMIVYAADNTESYPYLGPSRITAQPPVGDIPGGLMHDMFALVGNGQVGAKQFICKSDPAKPTASMVPMSITTAFPPYTPTYWAAPGRDPDLTYSYSFAFQYSKSNELGNWWRNTVDASVAIAADMNPGNQNSKAVKNSLNHQGDGQNVGFADGHAEFTRTPTCGENGDHIYNTGIANNPSAPGTIGQPPFVAPAGNKPGSSDTCLVPGLADTTAHTRK
jgi:prepilin-type processing-associated H-X9-DG protein